MASFVFKLLRIFYFVLQLYVFCCGIKLLATFNNRNSNIAFLVNYYSLLQVDQSATAQEIRRAYRSKAIKLHPDVNPDPLSKKMLRQEMVALSEAYAVLSDPEARVAYNEQYFMRATAPKLLIFLSTLRLLISLWRQMIRYRLQTVCLSFFFFLLQIKILIWKASDFTDSTFLTIFHQNTLFYLLKSIWIILSSAIYLCIMMYR